MKFILQLPIDTLIFLFGCGINNSQIRFSIKVYLRITHKKMYLHLKTEDGRLVGHLDDLRLGSEVKLFLPN